MDAVVTAGGIPRPNDPLYSYSNGDSKALIDVAGKPMIQWVLDALNGARQVDNIIVTGLSAKSNLVSTKPLYYLSNQGRMLSNMVAGIGKARELNPETKYVLIVSSDIPAVKPAMVDWLISTAMQTRDDLYYGVVPRKVMEKRYPSSKRTYTRFKDAEVCGADMNVTHVRMATDHLDMWEVLIERRKNPVSQAAAIGFGTAFLLGTGQLTLNDAIRRVCERIGIKGRVIVWDHAEPGMDVDKPFQLEIIRRDLARSQRLAEGPGSGVKRAAGKSSKRKTARPKSKPKARSKSAKRKATAKARRK